MDTRDILRGAKALNMPIPDFRKLEEASYNTEVGKLEFSWPVQWRLYHAGYRRIKDLVEATPEELMLLRGFGKTRVAEVVKVLAYHGLKLNDVQLEV